MKISDHKVKVILLSLLEVTEVLHLKHAFFLKPLVLFFYKFTRSNKLCLLTVMFQVSYRTIGPLVSGCFYDVCALKYVTFKDDLLNELLLSKIMFKENNVI